MTMLNVDHRRIARMLLRAERLPLEGMVPLAEVLHRAYPRQVVAGDVVIREGEPARELLLVVRGSVVVKLKDARVMDVRVASLRAPLLLGHVAVIDGGKRSATCVMTSSGLLLKMPIAEVRSVLRSTGRGAEVLRDLLMANMFRHLGDASDRLRAYVQENPEDPVPVRRPGRS